MLIILVYTLMMESVCAYSCIGQINLISVSWHMDIVYFLIKDFIQALYKGHARHLYIYTCCFFSSV